jgi:[acyl-carrier-protein] S-malonyltransferase
MILPVSAPFHSPLMAPAREGMAPLLAAVPLRDPEVPVVSNVDARPLVRAADIRDALLRQIDQPVRWVESIERMSRDLGIGTFVEVGPGRVLAGLIKRIVPDATILSVGDPESLRELLAA